MLDRLKVWAQRIKKSVVALSIAARDSRTPRTAKAMALFVVAYALSPIDLIPDFIPVLGLLDDLILVPLGIMIAVKLIPADLWQDFQSQALQADQSPKVRWGAWIVVSMWVCFAMVIVVWWFR